MTLLEAIFMGLIQGLTEFLPVSSSGHLAIFKNFFHVNTDTGILFDVLLHLATLVAIFIAYWKDMKELMTEGCSIVGLWLQNGVTAVANLFSSDKKEYKKVITTPYRKFVVMIIISTIPTGVLGLVFEKLIGSASEALLLPGICLIVTGLVLLLADRMDGGSKTPETASYKDAAIIGTVQGFATMPGLSRSGSTITACLACGFDKKFAVKYSFIMSVPAVLGAVVLELKDFNQIQLQGNQLLYYIVGMVIAGVVGYICIKTVLNLVKNQKFKYFSYYCFLIGVISVIGFFVM